MTHIPPQSVVDIAELMPLALLGLLEPTHGLTTRTLAARLADAGHEIDLQELDALIDALTADGLTKRDPARPARVRLTPAGLALHQRELARVTHALGLPDPANLNAAREQLERMRADLLSTVSHELRTPLTLIRTSIGLLLESKPDAAMRERLLRNIKQSTDRMSALVADLLDLVRLRQDRAELTLRAVDLSDLTRAAAALMRPLFDEKSQRMILTTPQSGPIVTGDQRRLERALLNLLSNATIYSPSGAEVRISVSADDGRATISVADTGPGITPEAMGQLFEQFYTARTSSSSHNIGVGLGLPIVKGTVEAHGGQVEVESEPGAGSTFRIILPTVAGEKIPAP